MAETVGGPGGGARMVGEVRVQRVKALIKRERKSSQVFACACLCLFVFRAYLRGALIKYFLLTNLIKHLFLTKTIVIQCVAIVQRLKEEII